MLAAWEHPDRINPVRVLRVRLRGPVTLGHVLLLDEIGSPVVTGEQFSVGELAVAVMVCSEPSSVKARRSIESRWAGAALRTWGALCGSIKFEAECETFIEWFRLQCGGPEQVLVVRDGAPQPKPLSAPWYLSKLASAVGELGMSIGDAEAMPVKRLNQITSALVELRGGGQFVTKEDDDFFENVKAWEAERLSKKGAS